MIIREPGQDRPAIVIWWTVYCFVAGGFYLLSSVVQLIGGRGSSGLESDPAAAVLTLVFMFGVAIFYAAGPFLPRGRAAWVFGIVQMAVGLLCSFVMCLPVVIPLLVFWLRPECRDWFDGRTQPDDFAEVFD